MVKGIMPSKGFLEPQALPVIHTMMNGTIMAGITSMLMAGPDKRAASRPTAPAADVVGMATEPNGGAMELATRQTTAEKIGSKPRPTIIAAGIATGVPKPAMASMKPPKPHVSSITRTRLSLVTDVRRRLIISIAPVFTQIL